MSAPTVYQTTWEGGSRSGATAFRHHARVWRDERGIVRGEWFDNGGRGEKYGPAAGLLAERPSRDGIWRPFVAPGIPERLLAQAEEEYARRAA